MNEKRMSFRAFVTMGEGRRPCQKCRICFLYLTCFENRTENGLTKFIGIIPHSKITHTASIWLKISKKWGRMKFKIIFIICNLWSISVEMRAIICNQWSISVKMIVIIFTQWKSSSGRGAMVDKYNFYPQCCNKKMKSMMIMIRTKSNGGQLETRSARPARSQYLMLLRWGDSCLFYLSSISSWSSQ